jgi:xylulokinase
LGSHSTSVTAPTLGERATAAPASDAEATARDGYVVPEHIVAPFDVDVPLVLEPGRTGLVELVRDGEQAGATGLRVGTSTVDQLPSQIAAGPPGTRGHRASLLGESSTDDVCHHGGMDAAVGLDIGSTNVKAVLVGPDGRALARAQQPLFTERNGLHAEQDADDLWAAVANAVAELAALHPDVARDVGAIGVCSQYSSIVPVDANALPVGPMVMWSDHRGSDHSWAIIERHEEAFATWVDKHGIPTVGGGLALAHLLHLQLDRPDVHRETVAYLEPMDYVTARLTGRITATQHSMFMSQLCDNRTLGVRDYDDELVELAGVDRGKLPALIGVDDAVGTVDSHVADALGLPADTVVFAGCNDTAALGSAAGVDRPGWGGLAIGTTSVLVDSVADKRTDLDHEILSMPALSPDRYLVMAENGLGGRVVEYVLDELVYAGDALGDHGTDDPFLRLDDAINATTPGAAGVLFLPWLRGSLAPSSNPAMRGGFVNVSLDTRRVDLVRAVAEGVAHNLAWLLPHVEAFTGQRIDDVVFVGGAARSRAWCQIVADVLDRSVHAAAGADTAVACATGRLALARHGALDHDTIATGVELGDRFEPCGDHRARYDLHQTQFQAAFEALAPIHGALGTEHGDPT